MFRSNSFNLFYDSIEYFVSTLLWRFKLEDLSWLDRVFDATRSSEVVSRIPGDNMTIASGPRFRRAHSLVWSLQTIIYRAHSIGWLPSLTSSNYSWYEPKQSDFFILSTQLQFTGVLFPISHVAIDSMFLLLTRNASIQYDNLNANKAK